MGLDVAPARACLTAPCQLLYTVRRHDFRRIEASWDMASDMVEGTATFTNDDTDSIAERIRVVVVIDQVGNWRAVGGSDLTDEAAAGMARADLVGCGDELTCVVEADVLVPAGLAGSQVMNGKMAG